MTNPINTLGFAGDMLTTLGFGPEAELLETCPINTLGFGSGSLLITMGYACDAVEVAPPAAAETCPINVLGFGSGSLLITMGYACDAEEIPVPPDEESDVAIERPRHLLVRGGSGRRTPPLFERPHTRPLDQLKGWTVTATLLSVNGCSPSEGFESRASVLFDPRKRESVVAILRRVQSFARTFRIRMSLKRSGGPEPGQ